MDHHAYKPDEWPLFDLRVTRADGRAVLHLSVDFLVADYTSIRIILEELGLLYADVGAQLPALEIPFRDYLQGEREPPRRGATTATAGTGSTGSMTCRPLLDLPVVPYVAGGM